MLTFYSQQAFASGLGSQKLNCSPSAIRILGMSGSAHLNLVNVRPPPQRDYYESMEVEASNPYSF